MRQCGKHAKHDSYSEYDRQARQDEFEEVGRQRRGARADGGVVASFASAAAAFKAIEAATCTRARLLRRRVDGRHGAVEPRVLALRRVDGLRFPAALRYDRCAGHGGDRTDLRTGLVGERVRHERFRRGQLVLETAPTLPEDMP